MRAVLALWANDFKNTVRDRTINVLLFVPFIFAVFLRLAVPFIERYAPALSAYRALVLALFCMLAGIFPAFMMSFIMLDEKDESLFAAFRVLPISPRRFLLYRLTLVATASFGYAAIIVAGSGLVPFAAPTVLVLAAQCALLSPTATLIIVSVAANKIVGLTVLKGLFFALVLPAAAFVLSSGWLDLLAVLPSYWIYASFSARDAAELARGSAGAVVLHSALIAIFYRHFRRRVFQ